MAYATITDIEAEMGMEYDETTTPKQTEIEEWISQAETHIDLRLQTSFTTNTVTNEYHDFQDQQGWIKLDNTPVISVTTVQYNEKGLGETASWVELTDGYENDFLVYEDKGVIRFHSLNKRIPNGKKNLRVTYDWGRSTVPGDITWLTTLLVKERILSTKMNEIRNKSPLDMDIGEISIKHSFSAAQSQVQVAMKEAEDLYGARGKLRVYFDRNNFN